MPDYATIRRVCLGTLAWAACWTAPVVAETRIVICGEDGVVLTADLQAVVDHPSTAWRTSWPIGKINLRGQAPSSSREVAWLVGDKGTVLRSEDGGASWRGLGALEKADLSAVAARGHEGLAVGKNGRIVLLDGMTGQVGEIAGFGKEDLRGAAAGMSAFVVAGKNGTLAVSPDRRTWRPISTGLKQHLNAAAIVGEHGVVVGDKGVTLWSEDGGATWQSGFSGSENDLLGVALRGDGLAVAVGKKGAILVSADYGRNWRAHGGPGGATLNAAAFIGTAAVIAGDDGALLLSTDNAASWRALPSGTDRDLYGIGAVHGVTPLPEMPDTWSDVYDDAVADGSSSAPAPTPAPAPAAQPRRPSEAPAPSFSTGSRISQSPVVSRRVLQGARVEVRWADGRVRTYEAEGDWVETLPNGETRRYTHYKAQVMPPEDPADPAELQWLEAHAARLIALIEILADNSDAVSQYMSMESARDRSVFERIGRRADFCERLSLR